VKTRRIEGRLGRGDESVQDRAERHRASRAIPAAAERQDPAVRSQAHGLGQQRALPHAGRSADDHDAAVPGPERVQLPAQHVDLGLPTVQSGRH
jgi:hypothetical protein